MKTFLAFAKKETLHILRDWRTMLIALLMPIVLTLLFGFAISVEVENINVAVVAPKQSEAVRKAVEKVSENQYFTFKGWLQDEDMHRALKSGEVDAVIVFSADYERQLAERAAQNGVSNSAIQVLLDASNPNTSAAAAGYLQNILSSSSIQAPSLLETHILYNPQMKSAYNFVPVIMGLVLCLFCALMTSVSIVREKETGTMELLLVSPVRPIWILLSKMLPYFVLSCINLAVILLLAKFVLEIPMSGSIFALITLSILYLVLALAMGLFISTIAKSQTVALLGSAMLLMLPIIMLSGMMFPIENLPVVLRELSYIIPARYYIEAMRKLMIEGLGFASVIKEFLCLLGLTLLFVVVSLKKFNDKLE